jgi:predicted TIM-barrel fold metal-dependent hydrolase
VAETISDIRLRDFAPRAELVRTLSEVPRPAAGIVDIHNHLGRWHTGSWRVDDVEALVDLMDGAGVETIVNLDGCWTDELEANLDRYDRAHPGRFVTFARLDWTDCAEPGWPDRLAASLRDSIRRGARGLKVWKDVGLRVRDERGELLFLDDERLRDVWAVAAEAGVPVLVHTADPVAFFKPLDHTNERLEELVARPDWHFAGDEFPPLDRLLDALAAMVEANPSTTFIGAHVGCVAEDLDRVERLLDRCDNFFVDMAARIAELGRQPRRTARLIRNHPDRVLLGTDCAPPSPADYARYVRFLETEDEAFDYSDEPTPPTGRWTISGLGLPPELAAGVEGDNARRLLGIDGAGIDSTAGQHGTAARDPRA